MVRYKESWSSEIDVVAEDIRETILTIAVADEAGNPIEVADIGQVVYVSGQLKDDTGAVLKNALIVLYRNGVATANTDTTNESGIYSIPYTISPADIPTVKLATYFAGG